MTMNESETHRRGKLGGVFFRQGKRGIFQISFQDDGGREVRESTRTTDEAKAARMLEQRRRGVIACQQAGTIFESPRLRKQTVAKVLDAWEAECRLHGKFSETYESDKRQLLARFGNMTADSITKARIQEWQLQEKQNLDERKSLGRNAALNRKLTVLTSALKLAGVTPSFARDMKSLRLVEPPARTGSFTPGQFRMLHSAMSSPHFADAAMFLWLTGWRLSECIGKKIRNVYRAGACWSELECSLTGDSLTLPGERNKGRTTRKLPLTGSLAALIERRRKLRVATSDLIFHSGGGEPIGEASFRREFKKASIAAGVPNALVHDLRRSRAKIWGKSGVSENVARSLGGWKSSEVWRRYAIVDESDLILAQQKAEKYLLEEAEKQAEAKQISGAIN
jgi:integrase